MSLSPFRHRAAPVQPTTPPAEVKPEAKPEAKPAVVARSTTFSGGPVVQRETQVLRRPKPSRGVRREAWKVDIDHERQSIRVVRSNPSQAAFHIAVTHALVASRLLSQAKQGTKPTFSDYVQAMKGRDIDVYAPRISKDGEPGLAFGNGAVTVTASDIARLDKIGPLTWRGLQSSGIDCDLTRDKPLIDALASRACNPVRPTAMPSTVTITPSGGKREELLGMYTSGVSREEQEQNAKIIQSTLKKGYDAIRAVETWGDPKAPGARCFDFCLLRGLRKAETLPGKPALYEINPQGATKSFTLREDGTYTKTNTSKDGKMFEITRVRHWGSLADAKRLAAAAGGYMVLGDYYDPTVATAWDVRRKVCKSLQSTSNYTLSDAGDAIIAAARGYDARDVRGALKQPGITMDDALKALRLAGLEPPTDDLATWARGEIERRPALRNPADIGIDWPEDARGTQLWAGREPDRQSTFLCQEQHLPNTLAWLAATRLSDLVERGYEVDASEVTVGTFLPIKTNRIEFDLDGFKPPAGTDLEQRPEDFVRGWMDTYLPPELRQAAGLWANSSSAGFQNVGSVQGEDIYKFVGPNAKGKADMHLALELDGFHDPGLVGEWVYAHAKTKLIEQIEAGELQVKPGDKAKSLTGIDRSFFLTVQPLYGAPPNIIQGHGRDIGRRLADPLGDKRDGELFGAPAKLPTIDPEQVRAAHRELDEKLKALGVSPDGNGGSASSAPRVSNAPRQPRNNSGGNVSSDAALKAAMENVGRDKCGHMHQEVYTALSDYMRVIVMSGRDIGEDDITDAKAAMLDEIDIIRARDGGLYEADEAKYTDDYIESEARNVANRWNSRAERFAVENLAKAADLKARNSTREALFYGTSPLYSPFRRRQVQTDENGGGE